MPNFPFPAPRPSPLHKTSRSAAANPPSFGTGLWAATKQSNLGGSGLVGVVATQFGPNRLLLSRDVFFPTSNLGSVCEPPEPQDSKTDGDGVDGQPSAPHAHHGLAGEDAGLLLLELRVS